MAKCLICGDKKGKRNCHREEGDVCSVCCGENRVEKLCVPCEFFKSDKQQRRYNQMVKYGLNEMSSNFDLQSIAHDIEGVLCNWDKETDGNLNDMLAIRTFYHFFDIFVFGDKPTTIPAEDIRRGVDLLSERLNYLFDCFSIEQVLMVLGSVHFVAQRRSNGKRAYLDFIGQYVGLSPAPGMRVIPNGL